MNKFCILSTFVFLFLNCERLPEAHLEDVPFLPLVKKSVSYGDHFIIQANTGIVLEHDDTRLVPVVNALQSAWETHTGYALVKKGGKQQLALSLQDSLQGEAYAIKITPSKVKLAGGSAEGLFRGVKTLEQLLFFQQQKSAMETLYSLPTGVLEDQPRFSYRGSMLDVARHFFSMEDVKRYIDLLALYKINYLHLHLTDDQGWRLEIKRWPRLTTYGGSTEVGGGSGGFYTQEEYKEIVAYAAERFITVVPEFDLPGHTNAALASYPELNCNGIAPPLYTGIEVGFSSLCVDKEITFRFIDEVIEEIAALTPGPYIHIGGDESLSTKKKDYKVFIDRTQAIVAQHGKLTLGWDEIQSTTLLPKTVAQYWQSAENAKNTIAQGNKLLLSPASRAYLDMKYNDSTALGLEWAGKISVEHGYSWDPAALEEEIKEEHILGIEAPLWGETIEDFDDLSYLAFPRLLGYAEIGWTAQEERRWEEYKIRLAAHGALLKSKGVNFYPSPMVEWER